MKTIFFILMVISLGLSAYFIGVNASYRWTVETQERALAECNEEVTILLQEKQTAEDREAQIRYEELIEPDNLPFIEELYDNPPIEKVYEPPLVLPKDKPVCLDWAFVIDDEHCIKWSNN